MSYPLNDRRDTAYSAAAANENQGFFGDNLAMSLKNTFSALDAVKASSIANSEVERIRQAMAGIDSIASRQVRAFDSISSVAKLQREALGSMNGLAQQVEAITRADSFAAQQVKAALSSRNMLDWETPSMKQIKAAMEPSGVLGLLQKQELFANTHTEMLKSIERGTVAAQFEATLANASISRAALSAPEVEGVRQAALALSTPLADDMRRMAESFQRPTIAQYAEDALKLGGMPSISDSIQAYMAEIKERERSAIDQLLAWGLREPSLVAATGYAHLLAPAALLSGTAVGRNSATAALQVQAIPDSMRSDLRDMARQIIAAIENAKEPALQKYLLLVFYPLLLMFLNTLIAPISDVYVKKWLGESTQESTKQVKRNAAKVVGSPALLEEYRYISAQTLRARSSASAGSPLVGELQFGQAVRVVDKQKDFTLVSWQSPDGNVLIQGWVFSRYLKSFR